MVNVEAEVLNSRYGKVNAAAILDALDVPYTGSDSSVLSVCRDLGRVKKLLIFHGIQTPRWDYVYTLDDPIRDDLVFPVIVKPMYSDSPAKATQSSVVTDKKSLTEVVEEFLMKHETPVIVEEFIEGDEYHVAILGNEESLRVLPLSRAGFQNSSEGMLWPMYGTTRPKSSCSVLRRTYRKNWNRY